MSKFIVKPSLSESSVSLVVAGEMPAFLQDYLTNRNIKILTCENNPFIDPSVKSHADMSVVHLGRNRVVVDSSQENLKHLLEFEGFEVISTSSIVVISKLVIPSLLAPVVLSLPIYRVEPLHPVAACDI